MNAPVEYLINTASAAEIADHLLCCDADFTPPLSGRVEITEYAQKMANKAMRLEAWSGGTLIGLVAAYFDQLKRVAYITSVSVLRTWTGKGVATCLMGRCIEYAKASGMRQIGLEVSDENSAAIKLYEKIGFIAGKTNAPFVAMILYLKNGDAHEEQA